MILVDKDETQYELKRGSDINFRKEMGNKHLHWCILFTEKGKKTSISLRLRDVQRITKGRVKT